MLKTLWITGARTNTSAHFLRTHAGTAFGALDSETSIAFRSSSSVDSSIVTWLSAFGTIKSTDGVRGISEGEKFPVK